MARLYAGTASGTARRYLSASGTFAVAVWLKPDNLTGFSFPLTSGNPSGNYWAIRLASDADFTSVGYTGTSPATGSAISLDAADVDNGVFLAWVYDGTTWSKWKNGVKAVINAAITFALPTLSGGNTYVGGALTYLYEGAIAEVAIWNFAPSDADMALLGAGLMADQVAKSALAAYWPLRGNSSPELDYSQATLAAGNHLTVDAETKTMHPATVARLVQPQREPCWTLDVYHPTLGQLRAASTDLSSDIEADVLGGFYPRLLKNAESIVVTHDLPDPFHLVTVPSTTTVILDNVAGAFPFASEWRRVRASLRRYDRYTHELVTELTGVIVDSDISRTQAVFTLASYDASLLNTPVPRLLVNVDEFPSATDLLAPVPVVIGEGYVAAPACGRDTLGDPGGRDHLVCTTRDSADAAMPVTVESVWYDLLATPGLEAVSAWDTAPGSPAYASPTTFTVSGDPEHRYEDSAHGGMPIRCKTTAGGLGYVYTWVTDYTAGTVTVADAVLDAGLSNVEMVGEYLVERGRYTSATHDLLSVRFPGGEGDLGAVVVRAINNTTLRNPANAVAELLRHPAWSIGQTVNAASVAAAAAICAAAGLTNAVNGALAGDRQQRPLRDVLNDILMMRGMRPDFNGDTNEWTLIVDAPSTSVALTLQLGQGLSNNIKQLRSHRRQPLDQAVQTLRLRYGIQGRTAGNADATGGASFFASQNYNQQINATVTAGGSQERVITSPWLKSDGIAKLVFAYLAKRLRYNDEIVELDVGYEGRRLALADLVSVLVPSDAIEGNYRVRRIQRSLTSSQLILEGYDDSIYTFDPNDVWYDDGVGANTSTDTTDTQALASISGFGNNLVVNSDFSVGLRRAAIDFSDADAVARTIQMLPGWIIGTPPSIDAITVTRDDLDALSTIGGAYLTIVKNAVTNVLIGTVATLREMDLSDPTYLGSNLPVIAGQTYIVSAYCDQTEGWRIWVGWMDSTGHAHAVVNRSDPVMKINPNDVNGLGWKRHWCTVKAPADPGGGIFTASCVVWLQMDTTQTYKFDAVQFEAVGQHTVRPSHWKRHSKWGIDPAAIQPGTLRIRGDGETEHGTDQGLVSATLNWTSGTSVVAAGLIPGRCTVLGVTLRVLTTIVGPDGIDVGYATHPDAWGSQPDYRVIPLTAGTTTDVADFTVVNPVNFVSANPSDLIITSHNGIPASAGSIKATVHYTKLIPPTGA